MYDALKDNDIIITNNKDNVLNYLYKNKKMLNLKIMTLDEFKNNYFGYCDERAIYYLVKKYNYKFSVAKTYLNNFLFLPLKNELLENNLIIDNKMFVSNIKRIVIDCDIDPYVKKEIEKYDNITISHTVTREYNPIYELNDIEEEVNFAAINIRKLLDNLSINDIYICADNEYIPYLRRIFDFYHIPINLNENKQIYSLQIVQDFINKLMESHDLTASLKIIEKSFIYNEILEICNKYTFNDFDEIILYCIVEEIKNKTISNNKYRDAVNVVEIDSINEDGYYFILGFNQGIYPKIYKNEDFFSDKEKTKYGILTSIDKNIYEKQKFKNILKYSNITISYKMSSYKDIYYKSSLIDELNLKIVKPKINDYSYSHLYNKLALCRKLDTLIKYNVKDDDIDCLYYNYCDVPYLSYRNDYTKINKDSFLNFIKNNLLLSYSSIDNYYRCGFKYYLNNILKLKKYEDTFYIFIGNLFHYILSKAFEDNFNFDKSFNDYIKNRNMNNKEKFFIEKLKNDLLFTINVINTQNTYSSLNNECYEQKVYIDKSRNIKVTFMGIIDKMKYAQFDGKCVLAIIDYKTGNPSIDLNNLKYGINMQLPIYLYLAKNYKFEHVEIAGIYLQKIIPEKLNYSTDKDYTALLTKEYKLEGYTNSDINVLEKFDSSYASSNVIKSMRQTATGFSSYSKTLNDIEINQINNMVNKNIDTAVDKILDVDFKINPKRIDTTLVGCEYCTFKDICYRKEEDIVNLEKIEYSDFLGDDINA